MTTISLYKYNKAWASFGGYRCERHLNTDENFIIQSDGSFRINQRDGYRYYNLEYSTGKIAYWEYYDPFFKTFLYGQLSNAVGRLFTLELPTIEEDAELEPSMIKNTLYAKSLKPRSTNDTLVQPLSYDNFHSLCLTSFYNDYDRILIGVDLGYALLLSNYSDSLILFIYWIKAMNEVIERANFSIGDNPQEDYETFIQAEEPIEYDPSQSFDFDHLDDYRLRRGYRDDMILKYILSSYFIVKKALIRVIIRQLDTARDNGKIYPLSADAKEIFHSISEFTPDQDLLIKQIQKINLKDLMTPKEVD